jgi:hypothetical protein
MGGNGENLSEDQIQQLPADVEQAETETPAPELPSEPPIEEGEPVEGPVNPDAEVEGGVDQPHPDNTLPEIPEGGETPELPAEPEVPTDPSEPMPDVPNPEPVELDAGATLRNIVAAARKRCEKYKTAEQTTGRRGPAMATFSCVIAGTADLFPTPEQVLATIQSAAAEWLGLYTGGNIARRHTLAQRIIDGRYNVPKSS